MKCSSSVSISSFHSINSSFSWPAGLSPGSVFNKSIFFFLSLLLFFAFILNNCGSPPFEKQTIRMRASIASAILAFCAILAVQAAPVGEGNALVARNVEVLDGPVVDARSFEDNIEIEARDPKK